MTDACTTAAPHVFKIADATDWHAASARGTFEGSTDDVRDGFIHLSTREQLAGTLNKYFRGQDSLLLIAYDAAALGDALKWEVSRGGEYFPHYYAPLDTRHALWTKTLALDALGVPQIPKDAA